MLFAAAFLSHALHDLLQLDIMNAVFFSHSPHAAHSSHFSIESSHPGEASKFLLNVPTWIHFVALYFVPFKVGQLPCVDLKSSVPSGFKL